MTIFLALMIFVGGQFIGASFGYLLGVAITQAQARKELRA